MSNSSLPLRANFGLHLDFFLLISYSCCYTAYKLCWFLINLQTCLEVSITFYMCICGTCPRMHTPNCGMHRIMFTPVCVNPGIWSKALLKPLLHGQFKAGLLCPYTASNYTYIYVFFWLFITGCCYYNLSIVLAVFNDVFFLLMRTNCFVFLFYFWVSTVCGCDHVTMRQTPLLNCPWRDK